jgi:hypothetical protein
MKAPESRHKGQFSQPVALACEATDLPGRHPAGNGLLEGGRNLLREYAQQVTLLSIAILAFPRQSNTLAVPHCNRIFTFNAPNRGLAGVWVDCQWFDSLQFEHFGGATRDFRTVSVKFDRNEIRMLVCGCS